MANKREKVEAVTDFVFLGSKISADSDCSLEIKTLSPWKGKDDKPRQNIKCQRYHFAVKGPYVKAMNFLVVMYRYES